MMEERQQQIAERRSQIPRAYRQTYDRAVKGKSLRAAVNSFCLECVCWQIREVRDCTDLACPLYGVRPYQEFPQSGHDGHSGRPESTESMRDDCSRSKHVMCSDRSSVPMKGGRR
jgi:hypothetical protein